MRADGCCRPEVSCGHVIWCCQDQALVCVLTAVLSEPHFSAEEYAARGCEALSRVLESNQTLTSLTVFGVCSALCTVVRGVVLRLYRFHESTGVLFRSASVLQLFC